jgi:hypothetical protein
MMVAKHYGVHPQTLTTIRRSPLYWYDVAIMDMNARAGAEKDKQDRRAWMGESGTVDD